MHISKTEELSLKFLVNKKKKPVAMAGFLFAMKSFVFWHIAMVRIQFVLAFIFVCGFSFAQKSVNKSSAGLKADFHIYHFSDAESEIYFNVASRDLIYTTINGQNPSAAISIQYRVLTIENVKQVADSGSLVLNDVNADNSDKLITSSFKVKMNAGMDYQVRITIGDKKRSATRDYYLTAEKKNTNGRQNYLLRDGGVVKCIPFVAAGKYVIESKRNAGHEAQVRVYKRNYSLAPPPFSEQRFQQFNYASDSIYAVKFDANGLAELKITSGTFIHVVTDSSSRNGFTAFHFAEYFPRVMTPDVLIEPLRFLCSSDEFKLLKTAENKKLALDKYWLDRAGSKERARELIRVFYNRMQDANRNYSSYTEGWRTDRGMVYLIFGEPGSVDVSSDVETWTYGDKYSSSSLRFSFVKVENPFTGNDFSLQRLAVYKPEWYKAVDTWRMGRVYYFIQ